jgi:hypothetical protein
MVGINTLCHEYAGKTKSGIIVVAIWTINKINTNLVARGNRNNTPINISKSEKDK